MRAIPWESMKGKIMSDDEYRELARWAAVIDGSENAPGAARTSAEGDKATVERGVVHDWALAMKGAFGIGLTGLEAGADPPDFCAMWKDRSITIELAQLVDERDLGPKRAQIKGYEQPPFADRLWTAERFTRCVNALLDKKQTLYARRGQSFDVLVIHHEHLWLNAIQVRNWLVSDTFKARQNLRSAYLLLRYDPNETEYRPLFCLYGNLEQNVPAP